jgi:T5SS/PEP-CTERM-associated repeat protein
MKQFLPVLLGTVILFSFTGSARAQFNASSKTNTISAVHSNWVGNGTYVVGSNTFKDVLQIINSGVLSNGSGYLGYAANSSNNAVLVTGAGSVWSNVDLTVGLSGPRNSLTISNGGAVYDGTCWTGNNISSSSNAVTVTGIGSVWSNGFIFIALSSAGNTLTITNGGTVISDYCSVAGNPSSSNTVVTVTGTGSVWSVGLLDFGFAAPRTTLTIANGGAVYDNTCRTGNSSSSNNVLTVTGTGSVWSASSLFLGYSNSSGNRLVVTNGGVVYSDFLYAGYSGSSNVLIIAGGSVVASTAIIGFSDQLHGLTSNSVIRVDSGSLFVTNAADNGALVVSHADGKGNLILNGGSVTVDSLIATNGTNSVISLNGGTLTGGSVLIDNDLDCVIGSHFAFNTATITAHHLVITNGAMVFPSGLVQATGTTVSNGQPFVVGNGAFGAEYHLLGGVHSFNNGLRISNAATLTGCGTVNGSVTIDSGGSVFTDCGRLTFTGTVTNNYALAVDGTGNVLEFYGTVVNNGGILLYNGGTTDFHGTFINNGIVSNAGPVIVSSVSRIGDDMVIDAPSTNGFRYQLQIATSLVSPVWTNSGTAQPGTGSVLTFTDPGGATNKPNRFYQVDVIWP